MQKMKIEMGRGKKYLYTGSLYFWYWWHLWYWKRSPVNIQSSIIHSISEYFLLVWFPSNPTPTPSTCHTKKKWYVRNTQIEIWPYLCAVLVCMALAIARYSSWASCWAKYPFPCQVNSLHSAEKSNNKLNSSNSHLQFIDLT